MIDADLAKTLVLRKCEASSQSGERFAVQSCVLSEKGDYWIVRANSEDFVHRGMQESQYVGVDAYLVSTVSGKVETVGSGQGVGRYLEDQYGLAAAEGKHYVLVCGFDSGDRASVIRLRQKLGCTLQRAVQLTSTAAGAWLYGTRSALVHAQALFWQEGIATTIQLRADIESAAWIDHTAWQWDALKSTLGRTEEG